ncbi:MAG: signal peptidase I [Pseudomonadota bacterium]
MNPLDLIGNLFGFVAKPIAAVCKLISPTFFAHMGNDFASWLLILSVSTGVLYALDRFRFEPRRKLAAGGGTPAKPNWALDFGRQFFPVIIAVFMLRAFVVEPFRIPSGSMIPTLRIGDFILVNRFAYGLRCPVGNCVIFGEAAPKRGDVVVFRYPVDPRQDFIKRVIGLPGDSLRYVNKQLTINGEPIAQEIIGRFGDRLDTELTESLGSVRHSILTNADGRVQDFEFSVPEGQYFMMGDNRDGSSDSRFWGTVPAAYLKGRAFFVWMSWDSNAFRPAWSRIGHSIQ